MMPATLPDYYFPVRNYRAGNVLLIGESEDSATGGLDYKLEAIAEGSRTPVILATGNLAQAAIAAGGPDSSVALGEFEFGTYGWIALRLSVKASAGSVVYSAYFTGKR
jgi:hypothetical protein